MKIQHILSICILIYGIFYGVLLLTKTRPAQAASDFGQTPKDSPGEAKQTCCCKFALAEGIIYFLATMGFPDFVIHTLVLRKTGWVDIKHIPPTLVAASVTPGAIIAFSYLQTGSTIDLKTLFLCMAAIALGGFTGAGLVISLSGELIRRVMVIAMCFSMLALIIKMILTAGTTGEATGLTPLQLAIVLPIVFCFGFLNMFGIPMKPSATALFLLMGLSPMATLTLMLAMGFISPMSGGIRVLKGRQFHPGVVSSAVIFGSLGAVLGTLFTVSLNPIALNLILLGIMGFTVFTLAIQDKRT